MEKKIHFIWIGTLILDDYVTGILKRLHRNSVCEVNLWTDKPLLACDLFTRLMLNANNHNRQGPGQEKTVKIERHMTSYGWKLIYQESLFYIGSHKIGRLTKKTLKIREIQSSSRSKFESIPSTAALNGISKD